MGSVNIYSSYEYCGMLFIWCEQDFFPGGEREGGAIDLRVQRDPITGAPICRSTSLKGAIRGFLELTNKLGKTNINIRDIFGSSINEQVKYPGAIEFMNAGVILYPVQSYIGAFAFITSPYQLQEYWLSHARNYGDNWAIKLIEKLDNIRSKLNDKKAIIPSESIFDGSDIVLYGGEYILRANEYEVDQEFKKILNELVSKAIPRINNNPLAGYKYIESKIKTSTILLPDDKFIEVVNRTLPRVTRIALDYETKSVREGALFIQEVIPKHTLLASGIYKAIRYKDNDTINSFMNILRNALINVGGGETVGYGMIRLVVSK